MMGSYFKPLRRKIGVITLVIASVFMIGWIRSQISLDGVYLPVIPAFSKATGSGELLSWKRGLLLIIRVRSNSFPSFRAMLPRLRTWGRPSMARSVTDELSELLDSSIIRWNWKLCGAGYGEQVEEDTGNRGVWFFVLPYWSIVLPLTFVSGWFLLSKRRQTTKT